MVFFQLIVGNYACPPFPGRGPQILRCFRCLAFRFHVPRFPVSTGYAVKKTMLATRFTSYACSDFAPPGGSRRAAKPSIGRGSLFAMARLAQCLQVRSVVCSTTGERHDMVNLGRRDDSPFGEASDAQRVGGQESAPQPPPPRIVAALRATRPLGIRPPPCLSFMCFAEPPVCQHTTAGPSTRSPRPSRHRQAPRPPASASPPQPARSRTAATVPAWSSLRGAPSRSAPPPPNPNRRPGFPASFRAPNPASWCNRWCNRVFRCP